ncbi:LAME_0H01838g1_1 [Lachancea meyersii CBS 8951]|uniref:LAME_0H01838g1_1 n=1 Tax=Lachancea meyersii CBS 8951 TaxID=1266667 RepID=A0A1G4KD97_9SACH|nr:LAME_0H01838g1_1 [Lachancea meyersii CBS 8951]
MSKQRVISESTGLYRLSIVNKHNSSENDHEIEVSNVATPETPRKGLPISSPVRSPVKCASPAQMNSVRDAAPADSFSEQLLYKLASKRRQVVELKQQLLRAEHELESLEHQCKELSQSEKTVNSPDKLHKLTSRLQQTLEEVNSNPRLIKSKQSIGNFFQARKARPEADSLSIEEEPARSSPIANRFQKLRSSHAHPAFFDNLINKWQSFAVNEEDEHKFDSERPTEKYHIKSKLDYDDDEEITSESDDHSKLSDLGEDAVISTFKRESTAI